MAEDPYYLRRRWERVLALAIWCAPLMAFAIGVWLSR